MTNPYLESDFPDFNAEDEGVPVEPEIPTPLTARQQKFRGFLPVARAFADMSKTTRTRVGAVILGPDFEVRSSGWNGAPRRCKADVDARSDTRAGRLHWVVHAEANAIANAARSGTALAGSVIVVTHMPCMDCAKLIVQAGICEVLCPKPDAEFEAQWAADFKSARELFKECAITLTHV